MCDDKGGEHFVVIDDKEGPKAYRENRDRAIDLIVESIEAGLDPGEVEYVGL